MVAAATQKSQARNANDNEEEEDETVLKVPAKSLLKKYTDQLLKVDEDLGVVSGRKRSILADAKRDGLDTKVLQGVVKQLRSKVSESTQMTFNIYLEQLGEKPLYHIGAPTKH